jgi:hypothetical protein
LSTALDLIKGALRKINALANGETPPAAEAIDALSSLNRMLGSWNNSNLTVLGTKIEEFSLVANQNSYTIGDSGNFDTDVPLRVDSIYLKESDNLEYPVLIIDNQAWGRLINKDMTSPVPTHAYIDDNFPLRRIYFYPTPSEVKTVVLHNYRKLTVMSSLTTEFSLPDGYEEAIEYNLAIRLAPEYGKSISPEISTIANEALANIKRSKVKKAELGIDQALLGHGTYNILTGS